MTLTEAGRIHDRAWATQCALSRICGGCAMSLGRPVAFLGTADEEARNAFHLPPMHVACAEELLAVPGADPGWRLVTTAGFEFVRPSKEDLDPSARFVPNSLL
ncbi:MAG: hypothetical protein ACJ72E_05680 [Marmoricola sp.]